ncbi:MAG: hypothetical protein ISR65_18600 [Bacteriovoracaceae bacterium]|nr:hypothetical protein [Bacteriovoracaceae bacterium]
MIKILTLFITLQSAIAFGALSYEIELQMGDTSCDGHCLKEIKILKSNLSTKQIRKAYQDATNILGFDFINVVAVDYEDSTIKRNMLKKLKDHGITVNIEDLEYVGPTDDPGINPEEYLELYVQIIKLGNPDFQYKLTNPSWENTIDIGGYGLFSL